ncbi:MAG: LPS assembly lipoprotein LptE, partial [Achromobacter sp.]
GRVEQYELTLQFTFRLIDGKGNVLLPDTLLTVQRELPYNDQVVQAKEGEITVLFRNMQQILVDRIVRRVTSPEVREAAQAVAAGRPISADVPVIDPSVTLPQTRPPVWEQQRMSPMDRY